MTLTPDEAAKVERVRLIKARNFQQPDQSNFVRLMQLRMKFLLGLAAKDPRHRSTYLWHVATSSTVPLSEMDRLDLDPPNSIYEYMLEEEKQISG